MLSVTTSARRSRRWWIAAFALVVVAGPQLAAIPPALFAGATGECVMACSAEGRECCCKGSVGIAEPHAPEAAAHGRLASLEPLCRDLCAAFANKAPGGDLWLLAADRDGPARPRHQDRIASPPSAFSRLEHADPSTLPRPPPGSVALL